MTTTERLTRITQARADVAECRSRLRLAEEAQKHARKLLEIAGQSLLDTIDDDSPGLFDNQPTPSPTAQLTNYRKPDQPTPRKSGVTKSTA